MIDALGWKAPSFSSGPIAAQFSRDDEDWVHLESVVAENPDDERWFRESWSNIGADLLGDAGEGRKVFILYGHMTAERYWTDYGYEWDEYFEIMGEL